MSRKDDQPRLGELAGEVRTQLEYLQELGIESAIEFAGLETSRKPKRELPTMRPPEAPVSRPKEPVSLPVESAPRSGAPPPPAARLADLPRLGSPRVERGRPKSAPAARPAPSAPKSMEALFSGITAEHELPASGETLAAIHESIGACTLCPLHEGRTHIVHTEGDPTARLMFVGEAPGADEDAQARPFVGRAGQLLSKIIEAIGFRRDEVLIGNINRCRPPQNRPPMPNEVAACKPFLLREIGALRPEVIVVLGNTAMKNLLGTKEGITKVRGIFQDYYGIKVMPTFHPAYLLRDPSKKRETWDDLKKVRDYLTQTRRQA